MLKNLLTKHNKYYIIFIVIKMKLENEILF